MKVTMWKPPPRREYVAKPLDPGQRIEWDDHRNGGTVRRSGEIWSAGPVAASVWAVPDDSRGDVVAVKVRTDKASGTVHAMQIPRYPAGWARDAIRRAENVRRHGSVFAVEDEVTETYDWSYRRTTTYRALSWHADPDCPEAAGKDRSDKTGYWSVREVIAILTGEKLPTVDPRFCDRCIYLNEPESGASADVA